ncbi:diacylglycerol kinase family protein [Aurantimonas sp. VKM B-3413]|uniref:diacylglycerol/lipid kinase family protein n=1 Tax=Aurantimonas sp. VKM B-3413 TaxID=2779401 RepID=UPI001E3B5276|nr:diacylglycerol kinase family protein [Aurantimonas sp. VKM B-3413]MCB8838109.1 diacylglycerol kinase [Aurantimonas sp. VKM B-3413]
MNILVLLNRDGGTLKTTDLDWLADLLRDEFQVHGHQITVERGPGKEIVESIRRHAAREDIDVLLVGGGDGTVSAAAAALMGRKVALGILPAGTMNLFARTLQIPLELQEAVAALASGTVTDVDIATVNGEPFIHQYAVGLHARMVRFREHIHYGSKVGKMLATTRAIWMALRRLPLVELTMDVDGKVERLKSPAVAISNNLYGAGHLPFADDPRGGQLGVYICTQRNVRRVMRLTLDILTGRWRDNGDLAVRPAKRVEIAYSGHNHSNRAVQDGELVRLQDLTLVEIRPLALKVLVPSDATYLPQRGGSVDTAADKEAVTARS